MSQFEADQGLLHEPRARARRRSEADVASATGHQDHAAVLRLQRDAGNAAVSELLTGSPSILPNLAPDTTELVVLWGTNPVVSHGHASGLPQRHPGRFHPYRRVSDVRRRRSDGDN